ncbi:MAG: nucleotidyltransferase family protein [Clostridiales bacterium]|nr:nucleotidyltransferase family protein [Clostridiales bacterium]
MKICGIIAEYNPFHLGHLKQIEYVKNVLGAEKIIVVMSGHFSQRGEVAVLDKFTRAKHAIIAGTDLVIELPTIFATANAEIFAKGAINILNSIGIVDSICFGVESGYEDDYISLAKEMNNESRKFKKILKEKLDSGISLAKAKFETLSELGKDFDPSLIATPNNILGLEYTKAILSTKSKIKIYPMIREGEHNDKTLKDGITSASSIREVLKTGKIKKLKGNVPKFVFGDLTTYPFDYESISLASLITASTEKLKNILDCTEGLENRIKALVKDNHSLDVLVDKVCTKRYTKSRIQRIILSNLLNIDKELVFDSLDSSLYAKVLAVSSNAKDIIPLICKSASVPILTRKSDEMLLEKKALECFEKDILANDIYALVTNKKINEHQMIII